VWIKISTIFKTLLSTTDFTERVGFYTCTHKAKKKNKTAFKLAWVNEQTKLVIYTHFRIELTENASKSIVRQGLSEAFTTRISHFMF